MRCEDTGANGVSIFTCLAPTFLDIGTKGVRCIDIGSMAM